MKKYIASALMIFAFTLFLSNQFRTHAQYAYGASGIAYDGSTRYVFGYSRTEVDYYAGLYYDPYVEGFLYDQYNTYPLSYGASRGYEYVIPAEVNTDAFSSPSTRYDVISDHYVISYYSVSVNICDYYGFGEGCGYDPYGYSYLPGGGFGGSNYFYGPGGGYVPSRTYYLGSTGISGVTPPPDNPCGSARSTSLPKDSPRDSLPGTINFAATSSCQTQNADVKIPAEMRLSTGDTPESRPIYATIRPPEVTARVDFLSNLTGNYGGSSDATLFIPSITGNNIVSSTVDARPDTVASGLFNVKALANSKVGSSMLAIVPPQILLQMMRNEARGLRSTTVRSLLGWALRNRFGDSAGFNGQTTYEAAINNAATKDPNVTTGEQPELDSAASVFRARDNEDPTQGCQGFWSPLPAQWARVREIINTGSNDFSNTGIPFCYGGNCAATQIVLIPSVGNSNQYPNTPSFLFVRKRAAGEGNAFQIEEAAFNPIDDSPTFVAQHYRDFLGREPDQGGWDYWWNDMNGYGFPTPEAAYNHLIKAFLVSDAYRSRFGTP